MEVQIVKMSADDVDRVVEIEQECFSMPVSYTHLRAHET